MRLALTIAALALAVTAATAQPRTPPTPPPAPPPAAAPPPAPPVLEGPPPPYEAQLLRLSELLGALAYLRDLCGHNDGEEYRARMTGLLDAEAATGARRDRIAGSFNRGWREYEVMHRACTPVSREVVRRAMEEGAALAREIGHKFGAS